MREILVHLDDGERSSVRLDIAIGLAAKFKARLTGLFARCESDRSSAVAQKPSAFLAAVCKKAADDFAIKTFLHKNKNVFVDCAPKDLSPKLAGIRVQIRAPTGKTDE